MSYGAPNPRGLGHRRGFEISGSTEFDESYVGGKENNKHNNKKFKAERGAVYKVVVLGAKIRGQESSQGESHR